MPEKETRRKRRAGLRRVPWTSGGGLPLRGREAEAAALADRLAALVRGRGGVMVVEGPPGSGRTRLLAEVHARAVAAGLPCLRGSASLDRLAVPFGPLLEALCTGPAPLLDASETRPVRPADPRSWTLREARARLADAAARGPLVVCLDDVQWCDSATLAALPVLLADLADAPILWVLSVGPPPGAVGARVEALCRGGDRIVLGPLADRAVAELAADLLGARPGLAVLRAAGRAQGAPRLLVELLRGLAEEGRITVRDGIAATDGAAVPRRLRELVRGRLDQVSPQARQCVRVASVFDRAFTPAELAGLVGVSADELAVLVEEADGAGFLAGSDGLLGFRHDLVRQAISATLPSALRRCLRRRAVDVRLAHGGRAVDVAAELAETAAPGDHRAVDLLRRAAGDLAATAPARAVALSRRALDLAGPDGPHTAQIVAETVELLWRDGRYAEARQRAEAALEGFLTPEAEARLRWVMARLVGHAPSAEAHIAHAGRPRALENCVRAFTLTASGRIDEALREADEGVGAARRAGHRPVEALWAMSRARVLLDAGRLAAARAEADAALSASGDPGSEDFADTTARYAFGRAAVHMGDEEGVRRCAADGARMAAAETPAVRRTGTWLAALAADAAGDTARVAELVGLAWADSGAPGAAPDPADLVVLARLALRVELPGLAAEAAGRAAELDAEIPFLRGVADHTRGLLTDDPDLLLQAVKLLEDAERPLVRASAAEDAGRVLGAAGDPAARELLDSALDLYEECGAARDAARVRRRLRALGVRRVARSSGGAGGRWGLTAAEVKVALLVARGATNRQVAERLFLSSHTVGSHLRHIFTKWNITSRVDLTRQVLEREAA